jgi:hypothetical protein
MSQISPKENSYANTYEVNPIVLPSPLKHTETLICHLYVFFSCAISYCNLSARRDLTITPCCVIPPTIPPAISPAIPPAIPPAILPAFSRTPHTPFQSCLPSCCPTCCPTCHAHCPTPLCLHHCLTGLFITGDIAYNYTCVISPMYLCVLFLSRINDNLFIILILSTVQYILLCY